jgi:hypothetical protein
MEKSTPPIGAAPHEDFSDLYEKKGGKGESAREAHLVGGH